MKKQFDYFKTHVTVNQKMTATGKHGKGFYACVEVELYTTNKKSKEEAQAAGEEIRKKIEKSLK